jgi:7-cyano-7-deazaguanine synthase
MGESSTRPRLILLSGGLDSAAALFTTDFSECSSAMFIDYGQRTARAEQSAAQRLADLRGVAFRVVAVPGLAALGAGSLTGRPEAHGADGESDQQRDEWFPARNLMLLAIAGVAVGRAGGGEIIFGTQTVAYRDTRPAFFAAAQAALTDGLPVSHQVTLTVPMVSREEGLSAAVANGLDPRMTFSCNRRADRHCWRCASCTDRRESLTGLTTNG